MIASLVTDSRLLLRTLYAVATHVADDMPSVVECHLAGHPLPDERSVAAGHRTLGLATSVQPDETLLLLLSGGASSLLALPADGITLDDKRRTIEVMMRAGADIGPLNTVRKHLSALKGGQLAMRCAGSTLTLAVSDVIGDDVSVIGSGPGVADETTWTDAAAALDRFGDTRHPRRVRDRIASGLAGQLADTPKARHLGRADGRVIASRQDALNGARQKAEGLGYRVVVLTNPVVGEAKRSANDWLAEVQRSIAALVRRVCVISAGETTVRVIGTGKGGRNLEFALAMATELRMLARDAVASSLGTDGIDGPTDVAGAFVDRTTIERAAQLGVGEPAAYLDNNDSLSFFEPLGDLIRIGRTDTNVGDLQIYLQGDGP